MGLGREERGKFQQKGAATALRLLHQAAQGDNDALIRIAGEGDGTDDDGIWGAFEIFYSVLMQNNVMLVEFLERLLAMPPDCAAAANAAKEVIISQDLSLHQGVSPKCQGLLLIFLALSVFADEKAASDLVDQLNLMMR